MGVVGLARCCRDGHRAGWWKREAHHPGRHTAGPLLVWVLHAVPVQRDRSKEIPRYQAPKPQYTQSSTGALGQTAGSFGQTAGSYGVDSSSTTISVRAAGNQEQTAGSFGQTAGGYGTNAGNRGQTAGSVGQTAGSAGTSASNTGTTAGNFGHSLDTIADAGTLDAKAVADRTRAAARNVPEPPDPLRNRAQDDLQRSFHDLPVKFVSVMADHLKEKLAEVAGTEDAPDVVVGDPLPEEWLKIAPEAGVATLGTSWRYEQLNLQGDQRRVNRPWRLQAAALLTAPHPGAARVYVLWLDDAELKSFGSTTVPPYLDRPAAMAVSAVNAVLTGTSLEGDPDVAKFSPSLARSLAMNADSSGADDLQLATEVTEGVANARLAFIATATVVIGTRSVGVLHSLTVLRKASDGRWRVLQLSINLSREALTFMMSQLQPFARRDAEAQLGAISLSAPDDGDVRSPMPALGWENGGGGDLLLVEWQWRSGHDDWSDSRLYFVPEGSARLQTSTMARFATASLVYRWRVWSLGRGGALSLSGWRTVNVQR
jgi:hypothetical protein